MSRFIRALLVTGVPLGVLSTLVFIGGSELSLLGFALSAVGLSLLFGLVLGTAVYFFTSKVRFSVWNFVFLFFLMSIVSVTIGGFVSLVGNALPHGDWKQIQEPPEEVVSFTGPTCYSLGDQTVYISTAGGNFYSHQCKQRNQCAWKEVAEVPDQSSLNISSCSAQSRSNYRPPAPPGEIIASYQVDDIGPNCRGQTNYILLEDGSIWRWNRASCAGSGTIFLTLFAMFSLISSFLGCISLALQRGRGSWRDLHTLEP